MGYNFSFWSFLKTILFPIKPIIQIIFASFTFRDKNLTTCKSLRFLQHYNKKIWIFCMTWAELRSRVHTKRAMPNSLRYPLNLHLNNNEEDIVVFLSLKVFDFLLWNKSANTKKAVNFLIRKMQELRIFCNHCS